MTNLTETYKQSTDIIQPLQRDIENKTWFIERGKQSSNRELAQKAEDLCVKLQKEFGEDGKYEFVTERYKNFSIIIQYKEYAFNDIHRYTITHNCNLVFFNEYGKSLSMGMVENPTAPIEFVEKVMSIQTSPLFFEALTILKKSIEPFRELLAELQRERKELSNIAQAEIKRVNEIIFNALTNGEKLYFDVPTYLPTLDASFLSLQFVKDPKRKMGSLACEYMLGNDIVKVKNYFPTSKKLSTIMDHFDTLSWNKLNYRD